MNDEKRGLPTYKQLCESSPLLRREIGRVLNPGPWRHAWRRYGEWKGLSHIRDAQTYRCIKCRREIEQFYPNQFKDADCPIPDSDGHRHLLLCIRDLYRKLDDLGLIVDTLQDLPTGTGISSFLVLWERWMNMTETEQAAILLVALGAATIE